MTAQRGAAPPLLALQPVEPRRLDRRLVEGFERRRARAKQRLRLRAVGIVTGVAARRVPNSVALLSHANSIPQSIPISTGTVLFALCTRGRRLPAPRGMHNAGVFVYSAPHAILIRRRYEIQKQDCSDQG